jgi:dUTP pyrophosphatase
MYQLKIKLNADLDKETRAYYTNYKSSAYEGDSGFDLPLPQNIVLHKNNIDTINFGISCSMRNLKENRDVGYFLYPRSSISSTGIILANSVGIIDKGYRGNIMAKVRYFPTITCNFLLECIFSFFNLFQRRTRIVEKGTKLFQICAPTLDPIKILIVDELEETERGNKGFGSSGI